MTSTAQRDPWIRRFRPRPDAPVRLACLPHAGGAASAYIGLSEQLGSGVDVLAAQYPGRQDRISEPFLPTVHALADAVTAALAPWTDRPIGLFGHSMGSFVAFEVARRLEAAGVAPVALVVSARRPPSSTRTDSTHLGDDAALVAELRSLGGPGAELLDNAALRRYALAVVRADYAALAAHPPGDTSTVAAPITALVGDADPRTDAAEMRGWAAHTTGRFALHTVTGGHFYLLEHQARVAGMVADALAGDGRPPA